MTFLSPTLAGIAAAIAIPALVILYFLKLRRRDVEVSTTLLWKKAIEDLQANAPFQRLRNNILLILQLLALLAALFAIAQPQIRSMLSTGTRHVILIDRSASMQAEDGDSKVLGTRTRLDEAKRQALDLVESLAAPDLLGNGGDQAMVIAFDVGAAVLAPFIGNKAELRRAIEGITPMDSASALADAVRLARTQAERKITTETGPNGEQVVRQEVRAVGTIHVFSDGNLPDAARTEPSPEDVVVYHPIGSPDSWNVAVTTLRAERAFDDPSKLSIFVGVQSSAPDPKKFEVELAIAGQIVGIQDVSLPAGVRPAATAAPINPDGTTAEVATPRIAPVTGGVVFAIDRPDGGVVTAKLRVPDDQRDPRGPALEVDKIAYLVVPPAKRLSIALVSDGNLFLREVIEGLSLARPLEVVPTTRAQAFIASPRAAEFDVIVLDRWLPNVPSDSGKEQQGLPAGRFMIFGISPPPPLGVLDKGAGEPTVALDWRRDHPVLRNLSLDGLVVSPGRITEIPSGSAAIALATGQQGPLIAEVSDPSRRALVVTFDLLQSTWPLDPSFVLFIARGLDYLVGQSGDGSTGDLRPGGVLTQRLPAGAANISVKTPDGAGGALVADGTGTVNFAPLNRVGIYTLAWTGPLGPSDTKAASGGAQRVVAANLLDPAESDVAATPLIALGSNAKLIQPGVGGAAGGSSSGVLSLWPWLLMFALVVVLVEWWVYHRKVRL